MDDIRRLVPREKLQQFQRKSLAQGLWMLGFNWGLIAASMALVICLPSLLSVIVALLLLGGRQLGLGILMHECAHRALLPSAKANNWVGNWLCAAPMFADLEIYRGYHMSHHINTGTDADPDLPNYKGYPVTPASMVRKLLRDISGLTGLKAVATLLVLYSYDDPKKLQFGYAYRKQTADKKVQGQSISLPRRLKNILWNTRRVLLVQGLALALLSALGHPLVYLLWPLAWITTYMVYSRIRNAAEHGGLPGTMTTDPYQNTRTVLARWWERLTVAPNYVNFHFEHHVAPTVPAYQLPALHRWLKAQGALDNAQIVHGYTRVVRSLLSA